MWSNDEKSEKTWDAAAVALATDARVGFHSVYSDCRLCASAAAASLH